MRVGRVLQTVDWHTAGEPLRLITGGLPPLKGRTMLERRGGLGRGDGHVRRLLMRGARGPRGMLGARLFYNTDAADQLLCVESCGGPVI